jgi:hypothetical protein
MSDYRRVELGSTSGKSKGYPVASAPRAVLQPTQSPTQWVPGILPRVVKSGLGVTLTTHPNLEPRSRVSWSRTSSHPKRLGGLQRAGLYYEVTEINGNEMGETCSKHRPGSSTRTVLVSVTRSEPGNAKNMHCALPFCKRQRL